MSDLEQARTFYETVLGVLGEPVSPGRHYIDCGGTILALLDPRGDGESRDAAPNPEHIYFAVSDLQAVFERVRRSEAAEVDERINTWPWGERSFYARDPSGNPICFVDASTLFTGGRFFRGD